MTLQVLVLTVFLTGLDKHWIVRGIPPLWVTIAAFAKSAGGEKKIQTCRCLAIIISCNRNKVFLGFLRFCKEG